MDLSLNRFIIAPRWHVACLFCTVVNENSAMLAIFALQVGIA